MVEQCKNDTVWQCEAIVLRTSDRDTNGCISHEALDNGCSVEIEARIYQQLSVIHCRKNDERIYQTQR